MDSALLDAYWMGMALQSSRRLGYVAGWYMRRYSQPTVLCPPYSSHCRKFIQARLSAPSPIVVHSSGAANSGSRSK